MKFFIQVLASLALFGWLMVAMMSPMVVGSPESRNSSSALWNSAAIIGYPIVIGVIFYGLGWGLLGLRPRSLLLVCVVPPLILLLLYGIPQAAIKLLRGLRPYGYTLTSRAVYLHGSRIDGADPMSFEPLKDHFGYARDAQHVYYRTRCIPGADPASFAPLNEEEPIGYWLDRNAVYYNGKRVEHADPASFKPLSHFYARDHERVYYEGACMRDVDPSSFEVLGGGNYAKDRSGVYFFSSRPFAGVDPKSFEIIGDARFARDAQRVYRCPYFLNDPARIIEGADPATFMVLEHGCAKDKARVYRLDGKDIKVVEGADPSSFDPVP